MREDIRYYLLSSNGKDLDCKNQKEEQEMNIFLQKNSNLNEIIEYSENLKQQLKF